MYFASHFATWNIYIKIKQTHQTNKHKQFYLLCMMTVFICRMMSDERKGKKIMKIENKIFPEEEINGKEENLI